MMEKIPYPKAVFFVIIFEFCERFCFDGIKVVMTLYFRNALKWDEDFSTVIYHVWIMFCYFMPLVGAILADSVLGKFRTIFYLSVIYCCGSVVLSLAATPFLNIPKETFSVIGLVLIFIGAGGIKPCVSAFGGDQFKIPGQETQLATFFAVFYFSINSGSLIAQTFTPILREDVACFGDKSCYPLAFSVPAALMIIALVAFVLGRPTYKIVEPQGNVVLKVLKAIKHSFSRRGKEIEAGCKREHWLDYADDKFDQRFLDEAKVVFKILFLYIPLPLFWALFGQQGSRWTFQANRMNGNIFGGYGIKPDQMQVLNPILILLLIPVFDRVIYPLLGKCGILKKPLQRLSFGLLFAGLSFVVSGIVELFLLSTYAVELAKGESSLHIVNTLPCTITVTGINGNGLDSKDILPNEMILYKSIATKDYEFDISASGEGCRNVSFDKINSYTFNLISENATSFVIFKKFGTNEAYIAKSEVPDDLTKSENGDGKFRVMYIGFQDVKNITFNLDGEKGTYKFIPGGNDSDNAAIKELQPDKYQMSVFHSGAPHGVAFDIDLEMKLGGSYIVTVVRTKNDGEEDYAVGFHEITSPNSMHMLWLLPQYLLMAIGEVMFSITIMDFSYTEAPPSMKSVMQSAWMMTVTVGNLIIVIVARAKVFREQWKEFFLFAAIMMVDVLIFAFLAYIYKPTDKFWLRDDDEKKTEDPGDDAENTGQDNEAFERHE